MNLPGELVDQVAFEDIFNRLKELFEPAKRDAVALEDSQTSYMLNTPYTKKYGKEIYLGGVRIQKNYVSFYLMPVYIYPDLLIGVSSQLLKHMQGKSCLISKLSTRHFFLSFPHWLRMVLSNFARTGYCKKQVSRSNEPGNLDFLKIQIISGSGIRLDEDVLFPGSYSDAGSVISFFGRMCPTIIKVNKENSRTRNPAVYNFRKNG